MADNKNYDELLSMFESGQPPKKGNTQNNGQDEDVKKYVPKKDSTFFEDVRRSGDERRKRVENFKIDRSAADNGAEKPSFKAGVYFSNPPEKIEDNAHKQQGRRAQSTQGVKRFQVSAPPTTETQNRVKAMKEAKKRKAEEKYPNGKSPKDRFFYFLKVAAVVAVISTILCVYGVNCINDVLAIKADKVAVEVNVSKGMTEGEVIDILKDNDLIHNSLFCKLFMKVFGKDGEFVSGTYTLTPDMGVEKMISTMKADITLSETVKLTFPEGWTIEQIAQKLEANDVCTASSFITTLQTVDFSDEYSFIAAMPNKELRFRLLEGYMYPDTYEFYVGENASSVVRRFLNNFQNRWTEDYQKKADEIGMTVDQIVILASIIQKEAASAEQMPGVSAVLYNRLNNTSAFPRIECCSTEDYLLDTIKPTLTSSTEDVKKYVTFRDDYDTYSADCQGLPVGAIANPGDSAIKAALDPDDISYYYFRHDKNGKIYYANTLAEHEQNGREVARVDAQ